MNDVIIVENYVDCQCIKHLHLMSNYFIDRPSASLEQGILKQEAGVWHYRAEYPYRGILDIACIDGGRNFRRLVVWSLAGCGSIRAALSEAHTYFWFLFRFQPGYAFIRKLPSTVENGQDVEGMVLLQSEWMLEKCVAVGGNQ